MINANSNNQTDGQTKKSALRNGELDFIKFLFSLCVIGIHTSLIGKSQNLISRGYLGVDFFFLISGYFLTKAVIRFKETAQPTWKSTLNYMKHRFHGIFLLFFLSFVFSFVCMTIIKEYTLNESLNAFIYSDIFELIPLQMQGYRSNYPTGTQWYLSALFFCEPIVFALIYKFGKTYTSLVAPLISIFLLGIILSTLGDLSSPGMSIGIFRSGLIRGFADISLGAVIYELANKLKTVSFTKLAKVLLSISRLLLLLFCFHCCFNETDEADGVFILASFVFLLLFFANADAYAKVFNHKLFYLLGRISVVNFMVHVKVGQTILYLFPELTDKAFYLSLYLFTIIVSIIILFVAFLIKKLFAKTKHYFVNKSEDISLN